MRTLLQAPHSDQTVGKRALSGRLAIFEAQLLCNSHLDEDEWVDRVFEYATDLIVLESGANSVAHSDALFLAGSGGACL